MSNRTSTPTTDVRASTESTQSPCLAVEDNCHDSIKSRLHWRIGRELRLASRVLDLGCGSAGLSSYLAKTYRQRVIGVYSTSSMTSKRQACSPSGLVRCIRGFASRLHYFVCDSSKDAVVMTWVLHGEQQPVTVLKEAYRALRPGGEALIVEFPQRWLADLGSHADYFRPEDVRELLARTGFCDIDVRLIENGQIIWARGFRPPRNPQDSMPLPHPK
jgi:ubiquinone/menaquinone biosynthesis C-methylase UbiE